MASAVVTSHTFVRAPRSRPHARHVDSRRLRRGPGVDPTPHREVRAADAAVRLVEEEQADLVRYVSNQSFDDEKVGLRVAVDGVTVVDGEFHVEDQHNWFSFSSEYVPRRP